MVQIDFHNKYLASLHKHVWLCFILPTKYLKFIFLLGHTCYLSCILYCLSHYKVERHIYIKQSLTEIHHACMFIMNCSCANITIASSAVVHKKKSLWTLIIFRISDIIIIFKSYLTPSLWHHIEEPFIY